MIHFNHKYSLIIFFLILLNSCNKNVDVNIYESIGYNDFLTNINKQKNSTWESNCIKCHSRNNNFIGFDKKNYWNKTAQKGIDTLFNHVYNGYNGKYGIMPPRGSCYECSEIEIKNSIFYLFYLSKHSKKTKNIN